MYVLHLQRCPALPGDFGNLSFSDGIRMILRYSSWSLQTNITVVMQALLPQPTTIRAAGITCDANASRVSHGLGRCQDAASSMKSLGFC